MPDKKYPLALPQGSVLAGQYIIEQVLGQGGFGITYMARDHKSGSKVAIKEFFPDSMATRTQTTVTAFEGERGESFAYGKTCFLKEAETLAEFIGNKNIVQVYSYFEENGTAYFVMDFVEGISFEQYIREHGGRVNYEEAEKILLPVMDALAAVHSRGIIHRDVTPDNIYITKDGTVRLLDFGAARYSLGDRSRSLDVVLKHGFAPKEQYTRHGKQGPYTDVYTLGASFYFAITGRRPPDSIDRLEEDDLIPPCRLGVAISQAEEDAILKAMNVQPSGRFQTMGEFKRALLAGGDEAAESDMAGSTERQKEPVQQRIFTKPEPPEQSIQPSAQRQMQVQPIQPSAQYQASLQGSPSSAQNQTLQQPMQISDGIQDNGMVRKKKWILPVGIGVGAAALIVVAAIAVSLGRREDTVEKPYVQYDLVEDDDYNITTGHTGKNDINNNYIDNNHIDMDNTDNDTIEKTDDDSMIPPEPEIEGPVSANVEILGNTPNNLMNYGQFVSDGNDVFLAYPGGHGMASVSGDGEAEFLDEDGYVRCISVVGDKIYYINTGDAYSMNRDGTNKKLIPELADYEKIATLYVSEDYYYIYMVGEGLKCIERNTGKVAGTLSCDDYRQLTFLDGYVYYLKKDEEEDGMGLWRIPADALSSESEFLIGPSELHNCSTIVSEGNYLYGIYKVSGEEGLEAVFIQYDVNSSQIVCTYTLAVTLEEGQDSDINLYNVCNQYVYLSYFLNVSDEDRSGGMYRFEADPDDDSFEIELVYEAKEAQHFNYLSMLKESQEVVITVWGDCAALIAANMDGSGEPVVLENELD
ncbi:MAG: protein kinase [Lachnospiraceae bacterium]|nr:protein kinase [Lachnospiraceae bacterium]